jgi:sulfide:quinone oxidoreductase
MTHEVVICGGGVAALEVAAALNELAGPRVNLTLVAPDDQFVYRPLVPACAFGYPEPPRVPLEQIADRVGADLVPDRAGWVDREAQVLHTAAGPRLSYDALVICVGASTRVRYEHAVTIDDRAAPSLEELVAEVQAGRVQRLAFVGHDRASWPLPLYEAALMTATVGAEAGRTLDLTIVTPELAPLQVFGERASAGMRSLLAELGIELFTRAHAEVPERGQVIVEHEPAGSGRMEIADRSWLLAVDRALALPELIGPHLRGLPSVDGGFIPIDHLCRVRGEERVFAAGDATDFPVKHGGLAAQQAEVVARAIAARVGAPLHPRPFRPRLEGLLLTGGLPLRLGAQLVGGHAFQSELSAEAAGGAQPKIVAERLNELLDPRRAPLR